MTDRITIVTPPDDILLDGIRILLIDLTEEQTNIVSTALKQSENNNIVAYLANGKDWNWIIDKKHKSDLIIFNAESDDHIAVGYFAAQPKSVYFGILKSLHIANDRAIYTVEDIIFLLENISKKHE